MKGIELEKYNKKEKKDSIFSYILWETIFIFAVATISIVLYDMYINIDVTPNQTYTAEKTVQEVNIDNPEDASEMLENISKSIVRNIKNNNK